jgi:hypothetical protein
MSRLIVFFAALTCLLAACSGFTAYRNNYEHNLFITTDTEERGLFSGVAASLDIYRMQGDCDTQYEGTVELGNSLVRVGIPTEEPAYLVFRFESSAFLSNSHSSMGYDVTLYPLTDHVYDLSVTYRDNIYNVEVQERLRGAADGEAMTIAMQDQPCIANM